jgi:ABC-type transporter lipoprotein component MlaA
MDGRPPAKRKGPPRSEIHAEQGKPIVLPVIGRRTARNAVGTVGTGVRRKRMPVCNGRDTSWDIARRESGQTSAWSFMAREL